MAEINVPLFEEEYKTFKRFLPIWLDQGISGFALIKVDAVLGPYETEKRAYIVGAEVFGYNEPVFVKAVGYIKPARTMNQLLPAESRLIPEEPSTGEVAIRGLTRLEEFPKYL